MSKDLQRKIGQLFVAGFAGKEITPELRAVAREFCLGGVVLFDRNIESPLQVAEIAYDVANLQKDIPAWLSVDQEGGKVARLRSPFTEWPAMALLGRSANRELSDRFGRALARELRLVGVTLDFAPVLDVNTNPRNPVIGERSLSDDVNNVCSLGAAIVRSIQDIGVAACGKHFPGHGDTDVDSHKALPIVERTFDEMKEIELKPFEAAIAENVAAIMTAHVVYPSLDDSGPATLSKRILTGILRGELGFEGLIVSDDLEMAAIAQHMSLAAATVKAVSSGCDLLLLCGMEIERQIEAIEALIYAVENSDVSIERIESALARSRRIKERFLVSRQGWRPPKQSEIDDVLGCEEHQSISDEIVRCAQ